MVCIISPLQGTKKRAVPEQPVSPMNQTGEQMRRSIIVILGILLLFANYLWAGLEEFHPVENEELVRYFGVHSKEEGPGYDHYGSLALRLHIKKAEMPVPIGNEDLEKINNFLGDQTNRKFKTKDYNNKFIIKFNSNAPWHKDKATVTLYINDLLLRDFKKEVKTGDEFYLFFYVKGFSTYTMETVGIVTEFLTVGGMKEYGLIK